MKIKIAEALAETPGKTIVPLGCYVYKDMTPMLTFTGAIVNAVEREHFLCVTHLADFKMASPEWQIHQIDVPDLSLRERLTLDRKLDGKSAEKIAEELGFKFDDDDETSLKLIRNYMLLYRYYPNYHRVQI